MPNIPDSRMPRSSAASAPCWPRHLRATPPRRRRSSQFTLAERPRRGGDPGPPHAGRHPHAVVPGRRRRRAGGQVRHRAFPRAPDVQGHGEESGRPLLAASRGASAARRTPSRRPTTPATSSASSREHLAELMEFEADRMTGLVLTDDIIVAERNVVLEERNQRIDNEPGARLSASRSRPRTISIIPTTGRSSAGATRWRRSTARTRSPSTGASTRPTTPCWWSRAT